MTTIAPAYQLAQRRYGPGALFLAPAGTIDGTWIPTSPVAGKFIVGTASGNVPGDTDFASVGITTDGTTFTYTVATANDEAAEYFSPIGTQVTGTTGTLAATLKTLNHATIRAALNAGTSAVSGTAAATTVATIEPPDPGQEVRSQLLWVSQDLNHVLVIYSAFQTGAYTLTGKKGIDGVALPMTWNMEQPDSSVSTKAFREFTTGTSWS